MNKAIFGGLASILIGCSSNPTNLEQNSNYFKQEETYYVQQVSFQEKNFQNKQKNFSKKYIVAVFSGQVSNQDIFGNNIVKSNSKKKTKYKYSDELAKEFTKISNISGIEYKVFLASQNITLPQRVKLAEDIRADIYLELHHDLVEISDIKNPKLERNSNEDLSEFEGFSLFYNNVKNHNFLDKIFASYIGDEMLKLNLKPNLSHSRNAIGENKILYDKTNGIYEGSFSYVLRNLRMPSVLFECSVIVKNINDEKMHNNQLHKKVVRGFHNAIIKFKEEINS